MKIHKRNFLPVLLLVISFIAGCYGPRMSTPYIDFQEPGEENGAFSREETIQRPLLIGLASVLSPHETIGHYRQIAQYVARKTGRPAVLIQRKTYAEINMLLANGDVDIAFMSTGAYSAYRGLNEIELLVMAEYDGTTLYNAQVIVPRDSKARSIEDLQGKTFAFTDPLSYSGHMVIEDYLRKKDVLPETFFSRYLYTYSHDRSLWAVANKLVDGASFDSQIYEYAQIKNPDLADKVRIIATIGPAPTGPVAVRTALNPETKQELQKIFLEMNEDPDTAAALKRLMIDRFVPPTPELYQSLRKLYDRTGAPL